MFRFHSNGNDVDTLDPTGQNPPEIAVSAAAVVAADADLDDDPTAPHVRLLPAIAAADQPPRPVPAVPSVHRELRSPERPVRRLADIGLPAHLTPPDGGLYPLITLLESVPAPTLPALRSGEKVAVVTLDVPDCADRAADEVVDAFEMAGRPLTDTQVHVLAWPDADEPRTARRAVEDLLAAVAALNPRLTLLRTTPDAAATSAYTACRRIPDAQLDLHHVQASHHPAAALAWGAPIAFLDGRPASPTLIAAVLVDHLAGGTA